MPDIPRANDYFKISDGFAGPDSDSDSRSGLEQAIAYLEEIEERLGVSDPTFRVLMKTKRAGYLLKLNRYEEVIDLCQEALAIIPDRFVTQGILRTAYNALGRYEEAEEVTISALPPAFSTAIRAHHYEDAANLLIDECARKDRTAIRIFKYLKGNLTIMKNTDESALSALVETLERKLEKDPYDAGCLRALGLVYRLDGKGKEAFDIFKRVHRHDPDDEFTLFMLSNFYPRGSREHHTAVRSLYRLRPDYVHYISFFAAVLQHERQFDYVTNLLEAAHSRLPGEIRITVLLAKTEVLNGNYDRADELVEPILEDYNAAKTYILSAFRRGDRAVVRARAESTLNKMLHETAAAALIAQAMDGDTELAVPDIKADLISRGANNEFISRTIIYAEKLVHRGQAISDSLNEDDDLTDTSPARGNENRTAGRARLG